MFNKDNYKGIFAYCGWNGGKIGWLLGCSVYFPYSNEDKTHKWTSNIKRPIKLPRPINLGCKRELISEEALNFHSRNSTDKMHAFRCFDGAGVPHPRVIPAKSIRGFSESVPKKFLGRQNRSSCGRGITLYDRTEKWPTIDKHSFFVEFLECKSEHRVHVFHGDIVCELNKDIKEGNFIHTREQGSTLSLGMISHPKREQILKHSINAVKCLDLDFGAVDIFIDVNDNIYVLEVNSDPGMPKIIAPLYAERFRRFFGMEEPKHYYINSMGEFTCTLEDKSKKYNF